MASAKDVSERPIKRPHVLVGSYGLKDSILYTKEMLEASPLNRQRMSTSSKERRARRYWQARQRRHRSRPYHVKKLPQDVSPSDIADPDGLLQPRPVLWLPPEPDLEDLEKPCTDLRDALDGIFTPVCISIGKPCAECWAYTFDVVALSANADGLSDSLAKRRKPRKASEYVACAVASLFVHGYVVDTVVLLTAKVYVAAFLDTWLRPAADMSVEARAALMVAGLSLAHKWLYGENLLAHDICYQMPRRTFALRDVQVWEIRILHALEWRINVPAERVTPHVIELNRIHMFAHACHK